jgi:hypothetical protein
MRSRFADKVEKGRVRHGRMASVWGEPFGAFEIMGPCGSKLTIIASDGKDVAEAEGWQHVSVLIANRPPNWQEMSYVKALFFDDDECVIQFHPPASQHINIQPHCLHLWKPPYPVPLPPRLLV